MIYAHKRLISIQIVIFLKRFQTLIYRYFETDINLVTNTAATIHPYRHRDASRSFVNSSSKRVLPLTHRSLYETQHHMRLSPK